MTLDDRKGTGLRAGKETDRATWSRKIISHNGDPRQQEDRGEEKNGLGRRKSCEARRNGFVLFVRQYKK